MYALAGITEDTCGIHVDEEFAKATRFRGRIAHGAMAAGFVFTVMSQMAARVHPRRRLVPVDVTLTTPIRFGDTVLAEIGVAGEDPERHEAVLDPRCSNPRDETVVKGTLSLKVA